jgi:uncharacterized protein YcnI
LKGLELKKSKLIAIAAAATLATTAIAMPASAHVSVIPGVSATANLTDAFTPGKNNTIFFRVGHGCAAETDIKDSTGKVVFAAPVVGATHTDHANTHAFSVTVPVAALGDAGTTLPRPAYVPGWKTSIKKNADSTYTVTWTAISRDFDLVNGPEGDVETTAFFDFGLRVAFAASAKATKVAFPALQKCLVDIPAVKASKGKKAVKASTVAIYESWDNTVDADKTDNVSHDTAPSVTVLG